MRPAVSKSSSIRKSGVFARSFIMAGGGQVFFKKGDILPYALPQIIFGEIPRVGITLELIINRNNHFLGKEKFLAHPSQELCLSHPPPEGDKSPGKYLS